MTKTELETLAREKAIAQVQKESLDGAIKAEDVVARQEELMKQYIAEMEAEDNTGLNGIHNQKAANAFMGGEVPVPAPAPIPELNAPTVDPVVLSAVKEEISTGTKWKGVSIDMLLVDRPTLKTRLTDAKILKEGVKLEGTAPQNKEDLIAKFEAFVLESETLAQMSDEQKKQSELYKQFVDVKEKYLNGKGVEVYINESAKPRVIGAKVEHDGKKENLDKINLLSAICLNIEEGAIPSAPGKIGAKVAKIAERKNLSQEAMQRRAAKPLAGLKYTVKFVIPAELKGSQTFYESIKAANPKEREAVRVRSAFSVKVALQEKDSMGRPTGNPKTVNNKIVYGTKRLQLLVDNVPKLDVRPEYKGFTYETGASTEVIMSIDKKAEILAAIPKDASKIRASLADKLRAKKEQAEKANSGVSAE